MSARLLFAVVVVGLIATAVAQTVSLSNNTATSGSIVTSTDFEFATQSNQDLQLVITLLSGSCAANYRDGSSLPLTAGARVVYIVSEGTSYHTVTACSIGSASKWYFSLTNRCTSTNVQYQITVTSVPRICTVPIPSGNGTDIYKVRTSDRWAYYSVPIPDPSEVRVLFRPVTASSSCTAHTMYTRMGQAPTIDFYDTKTSNGYNYGELYRWRGSCEPTGTLFVGVRIDCDSYSALEFFIQFQRFTRPCAVPLLAPFPNLQFWSIRALQFSHFVLPLSSMSKNISVEFAARALSGSGSTATKLFSRAANLPSVDFFDDATGTSSAVSLAYNACDLRSISGDLYVAVLNNNNDYYRTLDFQLSTKTVPVACNEQLLPAGTYTGEVGSYWFQRYSVELGDATRVIVNAASRQGSSTNYVGLFGRWGSEPDGSNYDLRSYGQSPATIYYDSCDPTGTPRTGTLFVAIQSGSSGYDLSYTIKPYFFNRPCVLSIPTEGLYVTETAYVNGGFPFYYSWQATTGQKLTVDVRSSKSFEVRYQFNDVSTSSGSTLYNLPTQITATQTGTYYIRIRPTSYDISLSTPANITVSLYDATTVPPVAPPVRPAPPVAAPVAPPPPVANQVAPPVAAPTSSKVSSAPYRDANIVHIFVSLFVAFAQILILCA